MTRKSAAVSLVMLGTAGVFLGCNSNSKPTGTDTRTGYRYRSHSVIFIPMGGFSSGGGGRMPAAGVTPGRSGFGRSGSVGS